MAQLMTKSLVTILRSWRFGGPSGKKYIARQFKITVPKADTTSYGDGTTSAIPAAAFDLSSIIDCSNLVTKRSSVDKLILARPSDDGSKMLTFSLVQATDANRWDIAGVVVRIDASNDGEYWGVVYGY